MAGQAKGEEALLREIKEKREKLLRMQVVAKRGKPTAVVCFWSFIGLITETGQRLRLLLDRANMNRAMGTHKSYACPPGPTMYCSLALQLGVCETLLCPLAISDFHWLPASPGHRCYH